MSSYAKRSSEYLPSRRRELFPNALLRSLSLAMQTGAFIQLILTLTAITSRLTALVAEMIEVSQLVISVVDRLLVICKVC